MALDITSLERAIGQLEEALAYAGSDLARSDPKLAPHLRAAAILAFESTYELAHRMLRSRLAATEPDPDAVSCAPFNRLIRLGCERGLLAEELSGWLAFRDARGTTSRANDERKALQVFDIIPRFLAEARVLAKALKADARS
ncbi:MAG: nucleotidyltransferase substrate binding protein [Caulobacteraceae bacterium]|nr:nucleotidyltransferase substrate binding protein [Caulobacteraceae bacterium]